MKNHKRKLSVLNNGAKIGSEKKYSDEPDKEDGNRMHYDLTRQGKSKHSNKA